MLLHQPRLIVLDPCHNIWTSLCGTIACLVNTLADVPKHLALVLPGEELLSYRYCLLIACWFAAQESYTVIGQRLSTLLLGLIIRFPIADVVATGVSSPRGVSLFLRRIEILDQQKSLRFRK